MNKKVEDATPFGKEGGGKEDGCFVDGADRWC